MHRQQTERRLPSKKSSERLDVEDFVIRAERIRNSARASEERRKVLEKIKQRKRRGKT